MLCSALYEVQYTVVGRSDLKESLLSNRSLVPMTFIRNNSSPGLLLPVQDILLLLCFSSFSFVSASVCLSLLPFLSFYLSVSVSFAVSVCPTPCMAAVQLNLTSVIACDQTVQPVILRSVSLRMKRQILHLFILFISTCDII